MSNADFDDPVKSLEYLVNEPMTAIESPGEKCPLTYDYPLLKKLATTKDVVVQAMDERMRLYLKKHGYEVIENESKEGIQLIDELNANAKDLLDKTGLPIQNRRIDIGTPVMVERFDPSDPMKKINVIFGAVKVIDKKRADNGKKYIIAHPVDKDGLNQLSLSGQNRADDQKTFNPPLWYIEPKYPFGYHGNYPQIVSYPMADPGEVVMTTSHIKNASPLPQRIFQRFFNGRTK